MGLAASLMTACAPREVIPYKQLVADLTSLHAIARLDTPATEMICTYDRTGANEDYNHFQGRTKDGQLILADLKGPGVMTRFWFTGIQTNRKMRLYFDGESTPRFEFSWHDLRQGVAPFNIPPLSLDEQNCWHTFVPVPFRKSLLITTEDAGYQYGRWPKFYYQINWHPLLRGLSVESMQPGMDLTPLHKAAKAWSEPSPALLPDNAPEIVIAPGEARELWSGTGPATIEELIVESGEHDPEVLRNIILTIHWDGSTEPSVAVPLGDFFGSVWKRWRDGSRYFGSYGDVFFCRFPMPFQSSARITLQNMSAKPFVLRTHVESGPHREGGYFHANWRNSGPDMTGTPHNVLEARGRGRYAGCILSVNSADRSFWVLESDEIMTIDGDVTWLGTGLEDYFNAGWYYQNVFARPLHGLPDKAPFRTVQYRLHPNEPVQFNRSYQLTFERGPEQASRAYYESVGFYYLEAPQPADSRLEQRTPPPDPVRQYTLMTDLLNFERKDDLAGQMHYLDWYASTYQPPFADILKLRHLACQYEAGLINLDELTRQASAYTNDAAAALTRLYREPEAALVQLYANMPSRLFLNGQPLLDAGDPQQVASTIIQLPPGHHVLVAVSGWQEYPKWTQVAVRNANGFIIGTDGTWKHAVNPRGNWTDPNFDDSTWGELRDDDGRVKGPPEEPYVWVDPDPFINNLSRANGLRPSDPWPDKQGRVVYRKVFTVEAP
jgi:hypothetical protein